MVNGIPNALFLKFFLEDFKIKIKSGTAFLSWAPAGALLLLLALLNSGCAGRYFAPAPSPGATGAFTLETLPFREYWTGIVFNGRKIGFSHLSISEVPDDAGRFALRSQASLSFQFLGYRKKIILKSMDYVNKDLSLAAFEYDYDMDGSRMRVAGEVLSDAVAFTVTAGGQTRSERLPAGGDVYPVGGVMLYPVIRGLAPGRSYEFEVFDGETQTVSTAVQKTLRHETSDLFSGKALKIKTSLHGRSVTTWLDAAGRPLLEMSMGGVLISALEPRRAAQKHLAEAALNKAETFLEFSLIPVDPPIRDPENIKTMEIVLSGYNMDRPPPSDEAQHCARRGEDIICRISRVDVSAPSGPSGRALTDAEKATYLSPSPMIASAHPAIGQKAADIVRGIENDFEKVKRLSDWVYRNIEKIPADVFSALDVLTNKKAECQGHALLYAAFARSEGVPTRVVNGVVYVPQYRGFLYHTWAESFVNGRWTPIDPTLGRVPADAARIKFVEGASLARLAPLAGLIGNLEVKVVRSRSEKTAGD